MLDKIAKFLISVILWLEHTDLYYKPYESNILGEHQRTRDKK